MLATLASKRELAEAVLDGRGVASDVRMTSSRETFLNRLKQVMGERPSPVPARRTQATRERRARKKYRTPPLERFKQDLLTELADRVQLVRSGPQPAGPGEAVLVVVDGDADQAAGVIRRLHARALGEAGGSVEVVDRNTFETIERLASLGLVTLPGQPGAELHRGPGVARRGPSPEELRLDRARELSAQAERKAQMAGVLAKGGFPAEGLAPLRDAVELALRGLTVLSGDDVAWEKPDAVTASVLHARVVPAGLLVPGDASWVSSLRELSTTDAVEETLARQLVTAGEKLIGSAQATIARWSLGRAAVPE
jgi:hypothetical protein